jgi:parallel beta-helix repeat protein
MKAFKPIFIFTFVVLMVVSLGSWSYSQSNIAIDEEKLANIIDSPRTKQILANKIDGIPGIIFDMNTLAYDFFRTYVIVATVDFTHSPSGRQGTASFAYRWLDGEFVLIYSSYWLWNTVVSGNISSDTTWNAAGSPYYVTGWLDVNSGVTLTIETGTVVRFRKQTQWGLEIDVGGTLNCDGATFTTSCDFEEYDQSQVYDSDWWGFWIYGDGGCTISNSQIEYADGFYAYSCNGDITVSGCTFKRCYGGVGLNQTNGTCLIEDNIFDECDEGVYCSWQNGPIDITGNTMMGNDYGWCGVYCYESSPTISGNTFSDLYYGVYCYSNSSPTVTGNTLQDNYYGLYAETNSVPVVNNNNIMGNSNYGLYYDNSAGTLNAENNWWGDATGPYHDTLNPGGLGDYVTNGVDFEPWAVAIIPVAFAAIKVQ